MSCMNYLLYFPLKVYLKLSLLLFFILFLLLLLVLLLQLLIVLISVLVAGTEKGKKNSDLLTVSFCLCLRQGSGHLWSSSTFYGYYL